MEVEHIISHKLQRKIFSFCEVLSFVILHEVPNLSSFKVFTGCKLDFLWWRRKRRRRKRKKRNGERSLLQANWLYLCQRCSSSIVFLICIARGQIIGYVVVLESLTFIKSTIVSSLCKEFAKIVCRDA